jgi:hypothetical protein
VVLKFPELTPVQFHAAISSSRLPRRRFFAKLFHRKHSAAQILCVSANNSMFSVTPRKEISRLTVPYPLIAPQLCNPYHRVEFCGVNPSTSSSFHKVINTHVQNFIAQK